TAARWQPLSGDPGLHSLQGRCLWSEGELDRGTRCLVLRELPQELCDLILQDVPDANARELAVGKDVLQLVTKTSLRDANALLAAYKVRYSHNRMTGSAVGAAATAWAGVGVRVHP
ncbi:unnamed protein product, partial [Ectocarpus sp. 12 AP-2014]